MFFSKCLIHMVNDQKRNADLNTSFQRMTLMIPCFIKTVWPKRLCKTDWPITLQKQWAFFETIVNSQDFSSLCNFLRQQDQPAWRKSLNGEHQGLLLRIWRRSTLLKDIKFSCQNVALTCNLHQQQKPLYYQVTLLQAEKTPSLFSVMWRTTLNFLCYCDAQKDLPV